MNRLKEESPSLGESLRRNEVKGLVVSTVKMLAGYFETAIIDLNGAHAVERYDKEEDALSGHDHWCIEAVSATEVTKLEWLGMVEEEVIQLKRKVA